MLPYCDANNTPGREGCLQIAEIVLPSKVPATRIHVAPWSKDLTRPCEVAASRPPSMATIPLIAVSDPGSEAARYPAPSADIHNPALVIAATDWGPIWTRDRM